MKDLEARFLDAFQAEIVLSAENEFYACPNCNNVIDNCKCACPYCGEVAGCDCAIGRGNATGG